MGSYSDDKYVEGSRVRILESPYTVSRGIAGREMEIASRPAALNKNGVIEVRMPGALRSESSEYVRPSEVEDVG